MQIPNDPWKDLIPPSSTGTLSALRVDPGIPWGFFWAKGYDKRCMLTLQHSSDISIKGPLPLLKGIDCSLTLDQSTGLRLLTLKLLDLSLHDLFHRLCLDIVTSSTRASSEVDAVARTIARTWRWHHLLRGGRDSRLTSEEQKGLIGELLALEKFMLPTLSARDAISSWRGPLGAPKDFQIGRIAIEVKARRGGATPYVAISSEFQLDRSGTDVLFLHVSELDEAIPDSVGASTLTSIAERVRSIVRSLDESAADTFESVLASAGLRWEDDYTDALWVHGLDHSYRVEEGFPSITPNSFETGVSMVRYSISLADCEVFRVPGDMITANLQGGQVGH